MFFVIVKSILSDEKQAPKRMSKHPVQHELKLFQIQILKAMKLLSFILSVITFTITLFFLVSDFPNLASLNGIIYFAMMFILLMICIMGIILNWPLLRRIHNRFRLN